MHIHHKHNVCIDIDIDVLKQHIIEIYYLIFKSDNGKINKIKSITFTFELLTDKTLGEVKHRVTVIK